MAGQAATKDDLDALSDELRGEIRGLGVGLERVEGYVRAMAEGLTANREKLERDLAALESKLSERITCLEEVVRQNSADIRELRVEVATLRERFDKRDRLDELEVRVATVEAQLGITRR